MYIEFEDLKAKVPIEKVVQMLGLTMKRKPADLRSPCPTCRSGGDNALSVTTTGKYANTFTCWAIKKPTRGDCIGLAAHILNLDNQQAAEKIAKHFGFDSASTAPSPRPDKETGTPSAKGMPALDDLDPFHEDLEALGISPATANALGIGHRDKGTLGAGVHIPLRDDQGVLVGYMRVNLDDPVPFKFPTNLEDRATGKVIPMRRKA